ncbi:MAG: hypothetical protein R3F60_04815 [bacterium]
MAAGLREQRPGGEPAGGRRGHGRCPALDAAPDAALSRLLHVGQTGDPRPPDGSQARPWPTPDEAAAQARPGDVIFLLPGRHPALARLPAGVELLGAGADVTTLAGPLTLDAPDARIGGLRLEDGVLAVLAPATLHDLEVTGAAQPLETHVEIRAAAQLSDVWVRDVEAGEAGAVVVETPDAVRWEGGGVAQVTGVGVRALQADLTLRGVDLVAVAGMGVLGDGGRYLVEDVRCRATAGAGLRFLEADTTVRGLVVEDVAYDPSQNTGSGLGIIGGTADVQQLTAARVERGLRATLGAAVTGRGIHVVEAQNDGVTAHQEARVDLADVEVDGAGNAGLTVSGATAIVAGLRVDGARRAGVFVADGEAVLGAVTIGPAPERGVTALRSRVQIDGLGVRGAVVGVQLTEPAGEAGHVRQARLTACGDAGLAVIGPGRVALGDLEVVGLVGGADPLPGGLQVFDAEIQVEGVTVTGGVGEGIHLEEAGGRVAGVAIEGHGPGIVVFDPVAGLRLDGVEVVGARGAGLLVSGGDLDVAGGRFAASLADAAIGSGDGVAVLAAALRLADTVAEGNEGSGLALLGGATAALSGQVELLDNGAYGAEVAYGCRLEGPSRPGERPGGQGGCP